MDGLGIPELLRGALALRELFITYVEADFTEEQALYLIGCILKRPVLPE